jgi:hypothetical protein
LDAMCAVITAESRRECVSASTGMLPIDHRTLD